MERETGRREQWADVAKGFCIVAVVLWHVVVKDYLRFGWHIGVPLPGAWGLLGEQLLPLRMPLFFTISGMFAASALRRPWREFGRSRVGRYLYLYLLWLVVHTAVFALVPVLPTDRAHDVAGFVTQLTVTPSNLWYLYALAVYAAVARALRGVPPALLLGAAACLSACAASGLLDTPGNRGGVYQQFVFFLAGVYLRPYLLEWARTASGRRLAWTLAAYVTVLAAMGLAGAERVPGVWPAVSCVAVAFGITLAALVARSPASASLAFLGRRTLPVYVMHMPLLALLHRLLAGPVTGLPRAEQLAAAAGYPILLTAVLVASTMLLYRMLRAPANWLFELPGTPAPGRRRPRHRRPRGRLSGARGTTAGRASAPARSG